MLDLCSYCRILWIFVAIPILATSIYFSTVRTLNDISGNKNQSALKKGMLQDKVFESTRLWTVQWYTNRKYNSQRALLYTQSNKNPSAWNFLSPKLQVTWRTVAIIIWVVFFPLYLHIRGISLSFSSFSSWWLTMTGVFANVSSLLLRREGCLPALPGNSVEFPCLLKGNGYGNTGGISKLKA